MFQSARSEFRSGDRVGRPTETPAVFLITPWAFALAFIGLVSITNMALAQPSQADSSIEFSIPSQSLGDALNRYGDVTGREALYETSLVAKQTSGDVRGVLTPNEALERLLLGTGLSARFVAEKSYVLLSMPVNQQAPLPTRSTAHLQYYRLIQENLLDALCRSKGARPGRYRFVAVFWIAPDGVIQNSRRVGSSGIADIDRQIDATLRNVRFGEPPPAGFAQPVLILIVPQAPGVTPGCDATGSSARPAGIAP